MIKNWAQSVLERKNTDRDWRLIGKSEPFWGVVSVDGLKSEHITEDKIADFYRSGVKDVDEMLDFIAKNLGDQRAFRRCLEFGCGVGRLLPALARHCDGVVGYDISDGMLNVARRHVQTPKVQLANTLASEGPFDWLISYMVFQHIPPQRGLKILADLLKRVGAGGVATIQFTISRPDALRPKIKTGLGLTLKTMIGAEDVGVISMFDYNLNDVLEIFHVYDFAEFHLRTTDHNGHRGVWIVSRRA
jgi:SAM-dependent methyltransferase